MKKAFFIIGLSFLFLSLAGTAQASSWEETLNEIPVQSGGRIKPFQSFAQETLLNVTGKRTWEGQSAEKVVLDWLARPEIWNTKPMIPVAFRPLRKELGATLIEHKASPQVLLNHKPFTELVDQGMQKQQRKEKLSQSEHERLSLYEKAYLFQKIASGELPLWVAHPGDPRESWFSLRHIDDPAEGPILASLYAQEDLLGFRTAAGELLAALQNGTDASKEIAAQKFKASLDKLFLSRNIQVDRSTLKQERIYHNLRPFHWAWHGYMAAFFLLLFAGVAKNRAGSALTGAGLILFLAGFFVHGYGFVLRCIVAGRPPVSNMYESIIWVSWAVCLFAFILYLFYKSKLILNAASLVATLALLIGESFPAVLDPTISPLVPVLRSNLWLTVHVLTITLSYGAFALAWGIGHAVVFRFAWSPKEHQANRVLAQYVYRAVQIGVILLAAGTVLGGVWANYSWGRFWGWDPKETWALIALLGYLAVLHGRFAGWLGVFGISVGAVIAFAGVVMAWYGVNFVLAAGLHSYGFGGGGAVYVLAAMLFDIALICILAYIYKFKFKQALAKKAS